MCKNIFVVDDYQINLTIAKMIIKRQGYFENVTCFLEAEKALAYLIDNKTSKANLPDYILLDLNMPGMDGWEFLDMFEDIRTLMIKPIDIYILSSSMDQRDVLRSKLYPSVKSFLSKPLNVHMLCSMAATKLASVS